MPMIPYFSIGALIPILSLAYRYPGTVVLWVLAMLRSAPIIAPDSACDLPASVS